MDIRQAATYVSMSRHTLYEMVSKHQVPHIKMGRKLLFDKTDIDQWLSTRKVDIDG